MKQLFIVLLTVLLLGCKETNIKLNDQIQEFTSFPKVDSLIFSPIADEVFGEPRNMLYMKEQLLINTTAIPGECFLVNYSLSENLVKSKAIVHGNGPDEMLSCDMIQADGKVWLYDMSKQRIGGIDIDSLLHGNYFVKQYYSVPMYFYNVALLNDSVLIGTNNLVEPYKLSYLNIVNGKIKGCASYSYLDEKKPLSVLIDASSCYINIHPVNGDILLSYRYTDVIEIYNKNGKLKNSTKGPLCFDAEFHVNPNNSMGKNKETRKAFVNSYVTSKFIYLLYSGCKRTEENWAYGTQIFVYSWDGKPLKCYLLNYPIYTFAINEEANEIYSYSIQTGELVKGKL